MCKKFKIRLNYKALFWTIFTVGAVVRILGLVANQSAGINQDEAFAGYEAWSLLHYGVDSYGNAFPMYFVSWGSGMNVLNSYLMIPFVALFGLKEWVIRLPQLILAVLCLPVMYDFTRRIFGKNIGILSMFLLAISPWHIMLSAWGLESNLAPGFLLIGAYFFLLGCEEKRWFLVLSAAFYGLSLYCYAILWVAVPFIVLFEYIIALYIGKLKFCRQIWYSLAVLFVLALPCMLFLLVNSGTIPEIKTAFFTIPKLVKSRINEVNAKLFLKRFFKAGGVIINQTDGHIFNATEQFGMFYQISLPFIIVGVYVAFRDGILSVIKKTNNKKWLIICQLLGCLPAIISIDANINRINCLHIPLIICIGLGIWQVGAWVNCKFKLTALAVYVASFALFCTMYFGTYRNALAENFQSGVGDALNYAMQSEKQICYSPDISYSKILFYSKTSPVDYKKSVKYMNFPSGFLIVESFDRYKRGYNLNELSDNYVYVIPSDAKEVFEKARFNIKSFGRYSVAFK